MPCQDYGPLEGHELQEAHTNASFREEAIASRERLNEMARIACEACRLLEKFSVFHELSQEARDWYAKHRKLDAQRIRDKILAKLSDEEAEEFKRVIALADF